MGIPAGLKSETLGKSSTHLVFGGLGIPSTPVFNIWINYNLFYILYQMLYFWIIIDI